VVRVRLKGVAVIMRITREVNADVYDDLRMADDKDKGNANENDFKMNDDANNVDNNNDNGNGLGEKQG
jgi:hypothetical protein